MTPAKNNLNFQRTRGLDDVDGVFTGDHEVLHVAAELFDLTAEQRPNATEDPDVALQLQDGVEVLPAFRLELALLLLQ